jgi:hypothetical protein
MTEKGYIRLNRKFFQNPLWSEARVYSKAEAWLDLIQSAGFEASTVMINGKVIDVQRGELPASRRYLELRWNWGSTKVSNFLKTLSDLAMINQRQTAGQTIIKLSKYETYNADRHAGKPQNKPEANQGQTTGKPEANQNKEFKERKNLNLNPLNPPKGETGDVPVKTGDAPSKTWRDDFEVYLTDLRTAYKSAVIDTAYITERAKYHPGLNIRLSLEKACNEFWATPAGWKHKKKSKSDGLNWRATFTKSLDQKFNHVWLQKGETNETNETGEQKKISYI